MYTTYREMSSLWPSTASDGLTSAIIAILEEPRAYMTWKLANQLVRLACPLALVCR